MAKCGMTLPDEKVGSTRARSVMIILKSDKPFIGEEKPIDPPEWCNSKCLNKRRPSTKVQIKILKI
jgi:hypothetical protein